MEQPSFGYLLLKTAGVLVLIIALMFFLVFLLRRYSPTLLRKYSSERQIKVIERCSLSPKHSLVLVEIDGIQFLVGIGPQNIVINEKSSSTSGGNREAPILNNEANL
ncbi:MAG: flagellar biosynthetic protein FliO [Thermodesulforhabdaceae bacterium]